MSGSSVEPDDTHAGVRTDLTSEQQLWSAWATSGDHAAREQLVIRYLPYARRIAARMYSRRGPLEVEFDEYYQLACVGMLDAMDRFDQAVGASFQTFSLARIEGSILNGLAKFSEVSEQVSMRKRLRRERVASLKSGVAARPGQKDALAYLADVAIGLALGYMLEDSAMFRPEHEEEGSGDSVYASAAWQQTRERVLAVVALLPERERQIIALHYFHALGFDHIGTVFGLTKGRVSQIHKVALERLKEALGEPEQFHFVR
jgi:RNA polymerase sigma factor FliA